MWYQRLEVQLRRVSRGLQQHADGGQPAEARQRSAGAELGAGDEGGGALLSIYLPTVRGCLFSCLLLLLRWSCLVVPSTDLECGQIGARVFEAQRDRLAPPFILRGVFSSVSKKGRTSKKQMTGVI